MLLSVDVPIVSDSDCNAAYAGVFDPNPIFPSMLCAGGPPGQLTLLEHIIYRLGLYDKITVTRTFFMIAQQVASILARVIPADLFSPVAELTLSSTESFHGVAAALWLLTRVSTPRCHTSLTGSLPTSSRKNVYFRPILQSRVLVAYPLLHHGYTQINSFQEIEILSFLFSCAL